MTGQAPLLACQGAVALIAENGNALGHQAGNGRPRGPDFGAGELLVVIAIQG